MAEDMGSPAQDIGWVEGCHAWKKEIKKATSGEYDGMSGNKMGQKSFINQWVTSCFSPTLSGFILKQSWRIFKASSNFFRASAAYWDFFFIYFRKKQQFSPSSSGINPRQMTKKKKILNRSICLCLPYFSSVQSRFLAPQKATKLKCLPKIFFHKHFGFKFWGGGKRC